MAEQNEIADIEYEILGTQVMAENEGGDDTDNPEEEETPLPGTPSIE